MERRPRIATTSLAGCFGCHMSLLDLDEAIEDLAGRVAFERTPLIDRKGFRGPVDVGVVEGGCANEDNVRVLREFREFCRVLVAVGDCAVSGGVPAMRNGIPARECLEEAYGEGRVPDDPVLPRLLERVVPCHEVVRIERHLPGCPPDPRAIRAAILAAIGDARCDAREGRA